MPHTFRELIALAPSRLYIVWSSRLEPDGTQMVNWVDPLDYYTIDQPGLSGAYRLQPIEYHLTKGDQIRILYPPFDRNCGPGSPIIAYQIKNGPIIPNASYFDR